MLVKISNDFELPLKEIVCIISLERGNEKTDNLKLLKNKNLIKLCDKEARSLVIANRKGEKFYYLSPYSALNINKKRIVFNK